MKVTKKLFYSIVAFNVSLLLCIYLCFAWFSGGSAKANVGGITTDVGKDGILKIDVDAYYLNETSGGYVLATNGNLNASGQSISSTVVFDYGSDGKLTSEKDVMRPYGSLSGVTTAVLFKVAYAIEVGEGRSYLVTASCSDKDIVVTKVSGQNAFTSHLSNAVGFNADVSLSTQSGKAIYTLGDEADKHFVKKYNGNYSKVTKLNLCTISSPQGFDGDVYEGEAYILMDYNKDEFGYVYSLVLSGGGNLTSSLIFSGGITIGMESYSEADDPVVQLNTQIANLGDVTNATSAKEIADLLNAYTSVQTTYLQLADKDDVVGFSKVENGLAALKVKNSLINLNITADALSRFTDNFTAVGQLKSLYASLTSDAKQYLTFDEQTKASELIARYDLLGSYNAVVDGHYIFDRNSGNENSAAGFIIGGSYSTVTDDDFAYCLKMDSSGSVTFSVDSQRVVTIVMYGISGQTSVRGLTVFSGGTTSYVSGEIDGDKYTVTLTLSAGTYKITQPRTEAGNGIQVRLAYMLVV